MDSGDLGGLHDSLKTFDNASMALRRVRRFQDVVEVLKKVFNGFRGNALSFKG